MSHWAVVFAVVAIYTLPSIIAFWRGHASKWGILILNIFGGWTVAAWLVCLIWALANRGASTTIVVNNHPVH